MQGWRSWKRAIVALLVALTMVAFDVKVPLVLSQEASAAVSGPESEPSVKGHPVPVPKVAEGAEEDQPRVKRSDPVWPRPGHGEAALTGKAVQVGDLPVAVAATKKTTSGKVRVETLPADAVNRLGGVGIAARVTRVEGAGAVRAEFSYASFRDAFGGNFDTRLGLLRLPACAVTVPRPRDCVVRPQPVTAHNDLAAGKLIADVQPDPATGESLPVAVAPSSRPKAAELAGKAFRTGSVYVLAAGVAGADGNFGATDLKPSGSWQAGTSGGGFDYSLPLPEAPSPAGNGPELSLRYDSSSVDGQGRWTNNQSGTVGVGWDLNAGFIERKYRRCYVDNFYHPETAELIWTADEMGVGGRAVCWESPDANDNDPTTTDMSGSELVINVGGRSAAIVKDTSGGWKTVPELGFKIEQLTGGADSQPYWQVTSQDGTVSRFGYRKDAQWQLPYVGNDVGEPCYDRYYNDAIPPTCTGVWRWNLDRETDRNENVVDYSYTRETNYFCLPSCAHEAYRVLPYDSGGMLAKVEWGHNSQLAGTTPTSRTVFTTAARDGGDVPTDLQCAAPTSCDNGAIAFFSTRKLTSVTAESANPATGGWDPVERLDLRQTWMYTRTDFGPPRDPVMWLDTAQQTGLAASPAITLPPLDFDAAMLAGRMDYDDMSDWTDLLSWRMVPHMSGFANGMGGRTEVTYGQADPCSGGKGRDGTDYFADKTGDCFQVDYSIEGNESWARFYKHLATKVVERDLVGGSPDITHSYEYLGGPGWVGPTEYAEPGLKPASSDWRGYGQVRTITGSGSDPDGYTVTSETFLRGMGTLVPDFDGGTILDAWPLMGQTLQRQTWKMTATSPRAYAEVESTRWEYLLKANGDVPGALDPYFVLRVRERTREKAAGGSWRYSDTKTLHNADGLPIKINSYGQDGVSTDNSCTSISYARNTDGGQWLIGFVSVVEKRTGDDCAAGTLVGKTVTLYDNGTDPATNKPSDGNATETRAYADTSTVSAGKASFDEYGRQTEVVDPLGKRTTTTYNPTTGWPSNGVVTTNPLNHQVQATTSRLHGEIVSIVDANGKKSELDYDALGRAVAMWAPGQPRSGGTPTATAAYDIPSSGGLSQPTAPIRTTLKRLLTGTGSAAKTVTTYSYEDGLGRTREAQATSPSGGRAVVVTTYDARGLPLAKTEPVHNTAAPGSGLLNPTLTNAAQWTKTLYDGLERPVAIISYHLAQELRRTTTAYPGADRTETVPPVGGKTVTVTDVFDRTTKIEEWKDGSSHQDTVYTYDVNDNLLTMTDAKGSVRTFTYDWLKRQTVAADPDAGRTTTGYDLAGRVAWKTDATGQKISIGYDDLGRVTTQWSGEAGTGAKLAEWSYDSVAKGQPASSTRYVGGQPYTQSVTAYDDNYRPTGNKISIPAVEGTLAGDYAFTSVYDAAGNLRQQGMPAAGGLPAETLTYTYTDYGLAKGLSSDLGGFTYVKDTLYSATGKLAERQFGTTGKIRRTLEHDATTGWLSRVTTTAKADTATPETVQDDRFGYNVAGQLNRIQDARQGQSECFTYDELLRLSAAFTTTAADCGGGGDGLGPDPYDQSYTYDAAGNLATLTSNGQAATYTYPAAGAGATRPNAVTSISRPSGTDTYTYDAAGRLSSRTVGGKQGTFDWDELGHLSKVTIDGQQTSMVYDADGERLIRRDAGGAATLYLGVMELKLSGGQVTGTRYYATADGTTVALRTGGTVTWLMAGLNNSQQLAVGDADGAVARQRYLPFGGRRGGDALPFTDRGFLGKTEDASGLVYLSARYYDPGIAKFISTDPVLSLQAPDWANPYSYAANNPITLSDPDGLKPRRAAKTADGDKPWKYNASRHNRAVDVAALLIKWMALLGYPSGKIVLEYHIPGAKKLGTDGKADIALITEDAIYLWEVKRNTVAAQGQNELAIYIKALKALPNQTGGRNVLPGFDLLLPVPNYVKETNEIVIAYSNAAKWGKNSGVIEYWVTKSRGPQQVPVVSPKTQPQPVPFPTPHLMPHVGDPGYTLEDLRRNAENRPKGLPALPPQLQGTLTGAAILGGIALSILSFGLYQPPGLAY
ncbi:RHS repeat-associated core domain-containing protein [Nonomuraea sp. NPDC003560]|uniref:RHS repeat-associated core domain-containing protein n=1 Tax=Nonomuraea sp. NPDC003560 TaxID=3364341 RepID=UPI00367A0ADA